MSIPFRDASFSTIINSEVIEHVPDSPEILAGSRRVLKPGGILIIGTPDYSRWSWWVLEWLYGKVHGGGYAEEHITHFTRASWARGSTHRGSRCSTAVTSASAR